MSNLLEKASILTTPTATNDGKLLSVKPAPYLGSELVINGDFATDSDWSKGTGWTISNGRATSDASANSYLNQQVYEIGKTYKLNFEVLEGTIELRSAQYSKGTGFYTTGTYSIEVIPTTTSTYFYVYTGFGQSSIDNVSVKEAIDGDFDFTRNSSATRVNENGLIEDVQILSGNLVTNGDFSQEGAELVTNGDFSNGSTGWSNPEGAATFSNDSVTIVGGSGNRRIVQANVTSPTSSQFKLEYEITDKVGTSDLKVYDTSGYVVIASTVGIHTHYFNTNLTTFYLNFSDSTGSITIDNVSVKEVGQDWTLGTGWSIGDDKAEATNAPFGSQLVDSTTLTASKKYRVSFVISDYVQGNVRVGVGNSFSSDVSSNGNYTFILTASNTNAFKAQTRSGGGTTLSISNISVIEITDDTNLPRIDYNGFSYQDALGSEEVVNGDFSNVGANWSLGNWTVENNKATINGQSGILSQASPTLVSGKKYKWTFEITEYNSGSVKLYSGSGGDAATYESSIGIHTQYFIANGTGKYFYSNSFNGSITNVSVKEVIGQEVVPDSGVGHILLEPQSTNLVTYSEDFTQWGQSGTPTLTSGQLAPDGTLGATKISGTIGSSYIALSSSSSETATRSIYAKTVSGTGTAKLMSFNGNTNNLFTLTEEWQRFELTGSSSVGGTSFYIDLRDNAQTLSEFIIWGAQSEELSYATSYIPTSGSTVTRLGETLNNAGSSDLINSTEGVLYAEISALANENLQRVLSVSDGTHNNTVKLGLYNNATDYRIFADVRLTGVNQAFLIFNFGAVAPTFKKCAIKYKQNDFALWIDGVEVATDTSGNTFSENTLNVSSFTRGDAAQNFYGKVKCVAVYKEALTDEELTCLTTI